MKKCKICGEKLEKREYPIQGYIKNTFFDIYTCKCCGTNTSDLENMDIEKYKNIYEKIYENSQIIPGYDRYVRYSNEILEVDNPIKYLTGEEDIYSSVYQCLEECFIENNDIRVLEIGSGLGYFTYALQNRGINIKGLDISKDAVEKAKKKYGDYYINADLLEYSKINENKYDVVIMTEVIEHLENPKIFLDAIYKMLRQEGKLIITTPSKDGYPKEISWNTDLPPIHIWWFGKKGIELLGKNSGFKKVNFYDMNKCRNVDKIVYSLDDIVRERNYIFNEDFSLNNKILRNNKSVVKRKIIRFIKKEKNMYEFLRKLNAKLKGRNVVFTSEANIICAILEK